MPEIILVLFLAAAFIGGYFIIGRIEDSLKEERRNSHF